MATKGTVELFSRCMKMKSINFEWQQFPRVYLHFKVDSSPRHTGINVLLPNLLYDFCKKKMNCYFFKIWWVTFDKQ